MPENSFKFLIAGVGGQGTVLASDILAEVGIRLGYDTKKSDILGLAVRGGSVVSHIQWAPKVHSPVLDEYDVDYLIGFEWLETLRRVTYIKPEGFILANDCRIDPMTVTSGQADYPAKESIMDDLNNAAAHVRIITGTQTALDLGNVLCFNIVVLGGLSKILGNEPDIWRDVIKDRVPSKILELNLTAYEKGRDLIK
ncbi:MAG: indolepyruvate oxidoreductase subunit beta [Deltaproteobacteria bacterium]|jgi:indolepyruvate ferredoxin oxidoreductase beta subunit|nr:indolepyruvate oxidoreductase subunit beta [Deltaproteobacteria bacterium]MBW2483123.1 indolepyruvate oxidoreductase subunit beta [Deltaproteobacteria bacterium]